MSAAELPVAAMPVAVSMAAVDLAATPAADLVDILAADSTVVDSADMVVADSTAAAADKADKTKVYIKSVACGPRFFVLWFSSAAFFIFAGWVIFKRSTSKCSTAFGASQRWPWLFFTSWNGLRRTIAIVLSVTGFLPSISFSVCQVLSSPMPTTTGSENWGLPNFSDRGLSGYIHWWSWARL